MRVFGAIVPPPTTFMAVSNSELAGERAVGSQLIGDRSIGTEAVFRQEFGTSA
jgi:hypothetical protein